MANDYWIQTYTGGKFSLSDPQPDDVKFEDVLYSLSQMCRFTGHSLAHYSVAQHCILVSEIVPYQYQAAGLIHDFPESVLGDWSSPYKALLRENFRDAWAEVEKHIARIEEVFSIAFGVEYPWPEQVHLADRLMLATEKRDLLMPAPFSWPALPPPRKEVVVPWSAETAEWKLRKRYQELKCLGLIR